jgi:four helix bundle protein
LRSYLEFGKKNIHNLNKLLIWNKSIDLAIEVYKATKDFPIEERYGITSQIRKAVVSIASNIAEGAGRNSVYEFIYFLGLSNGSSFELRTQLIISNSLHYLKDEHLQPLLIRINEMEKMNYGLQEKLKSK